MKLRLMSGAAALVFLAACGGGSTTPTTSTTAPVTEATSAAVPTVVTAASATPMMMETATAGMMDMTAEPTTGMMDETATTGVMMDETATAGMMMDETATAGMMMDETATAGMMETTTGMMETATTDGTTTADEGDPAAATAIREALRKQLTGGPFRSETTVESNGQTYTITGEYVPPSRLRATSDLGGASTETIIIDDKIWTKAGDTWTEVPSQGMNMSEMMGSLIGNPDESGLQISNAQAAGNEDVNGVNATVYTYDSAYTMQGVTANSTAKLWIDPANGLPIRAESDGEAAGIQTKTTQVITYDSSITIEAPTQ